MYKSGIKGEKFMSTRNNQDRVGTKPNTDPPPVIDVASEQSSPSLSFSTPTEFVELPSGGRYYAEGHPLHGVENVEIKFMTAKDEDILSSKNLIKQGVVIDRLLSNVIVDKRINPDDMLIGDKNALIVAARITGYGEEYNTNVNCPVCGMASKFSTNLQDVEPSKGGAAAVEGVEETEKGTFLFTLPRSKAEVEVRLLTGTDEKKLQQLSQKKKKYDLGETTFTDQLRTMIVSVNGNNDMNLITSLVENMPALDSRHLREVFRKITPNIDMTQVFECQNCGHSGDMEVPFTADFFWPRG
jgi:hypothetical protein